MVRSDKGSVRGPNRVTVRAPRGKYKQRNAGLDESGKVDKEPPLIKSFWSENKVASVMEMDFIWRKASRLRKNSFYWTT